MLLGDDPAAFFGGESWKAALLPREELATAQLEVARGRFAALRDRITPLGAMAEIQGITDIGAISDLGKLLFPQSFYKSYDVTHLEAGNVSRLSGWLQRLTMRPLNALRERAFPSLDEFFAVIERECGVRLVHSSGTTGKLSFFPRGTSEWQSHLRQMRALIPGWTGRPEDAYGAPPFAVIWAGFGGGHSAINGGAEVMRASFAKRLDLFMATMIGRPSVDWHWFVLQLENAKVAGRPQPRVSDYVLSKLDEMEAGREGYEGMLDTVLERMRGELRNERMAITGPPIVAHQLIARGLQQGMAGCCTPGSAVLTFGGTKRHGPIDNFERDVIRFTGLEGSLDSYGMTEMFGTTHRCQFGHYHLQVTQLPFVFDPESGAQLPAQGRQAGRFGVFDLMAQSFWGGTLSGDMVTLGWDPCNCGRNTPYVVGPIERSIDADEPLPRFAASEAAVSAAFETLTASIQ